MTSDVARDDSVAFRLYDFATGDEDARLCRDIPEEQCREQPRNFLCHVLSQALSKTGDGLADSKVVLPWLLGAVGAPVFLVGILVPILFGGTVIIEQIFRLPGLGQLLLEAVSTRDYPIITGVFLVTGVVVMLVNLIVDLCYGYLDPKVRFDR